MSKFRNTLLKAMPAFVAGTMTWNPRWSSLTLLVWGLVVVGDALAENWPGPPRPKSERKPLPTAFLWFAGGSGLVYALLALGLLWTENAESGWFALEVKASMVLLPSLCAYQWHRLGNEAFRWLPHALLAGLIVFMVWRIGYATASGDPTAWRYDGLAGPFHPTYMGLYLLLVAWLMTYERRWHGFVLAFAGLFVGLLASKAAWLVVGTMWFAEGARRCVGRRPGGMAMILSVGFLCAGAWWGDGGRWSEFAGHLNAPSKPVTHVESQLPQEQSGSQHITQTKRKSGSTAGRLQAWEASMAVVFASPFGVGTGDVTDALCDAYRVQGADYALKKRMNPHSVWLQMAVSHGWLGLLVMLMWWMGTLYLAYQKENILLLVWSIGWVLNGTIESLLELQQGVVPTLLLGCAFALLPKGKS
jgi:hypothetical protein